MTSTRSGGAYRAASEASASCARHGTGSALRSINPGMQILAAHDPAAAGLLAGATTREHPLAS